MCITLASLCLSRCRWCSASSSASSAAVSEVGEMSITIGHDGALVPNSPLARTWVFVWVQAAVHKELKSRYQEIQ
jgi:hypothetical protein